MDATVYLVRHGMHDWLRPGSNRLAGATGIPMNDDGRREVARIVTMLAGRALRWIAASPLRRTIETAELIARGHDLEVARDERLTEWALGPWEGMRIEEIQKRFPDQWRTWREDPARLRLPEVEALEQVADRMERSCLEWMEQGGEGVIVSHQDPLQALLCRLIEMPLSKMRALDIRTGSVCVARRSAHGVTVESVNAGIALL
ncbi:MAG TPA: histidine phosphatase family protein [bacterium]|nr:histidine phosphatase family protein [bacterium]